jgi:hypothetical protein
MRAASAALVSAFWLAACSDAFTPTPESVSGSYVATTLTVTDESTTTDFLGLGATLSLDFETDGTVTGHLFVPGGADDGSDIDTALGGVWALSDSRVAVDFPQDTPFPDFLFVAERTRLRGDETVDGVQLRIVLTRVESASD